MELQQLTDFVRRAARWVQRFRHRCGYGIHSPYAFALVTGVIYERGAYYAYAPLRAERLQSPCALREKDDQLLMRLANASGADNALVWGDEQVTALTLKYLQAGRRHCRFARVHSQSELDSHLHAQEGESIDFLYLDDPDAAQWSAVWNVLLPHVGPRAMFVVRGIHRTTQARHTWQQLIADERVRVTFDLHDFGIACFEQRLNKEDYVINYF